MKFLLQNRKNSNIVVFENRLRSFRVDDWPAEFPIISSSEQKVLFFKLFWNKIKTRMHSSRMRTVHCSSRLLGGGCLPGTGVSRGVGVCRGCLPRGVCPGGMLRGVCAQGGCLLRDVCPMGVCQGVCTQGVSHPSPCEQNDRCLWKHYLAAISLRTVNISESACEIE